MSGLVLQSAYASWVMAENDGKWVVYDSDGNELGRFPDTWGPKECMIAIRFGREFEKKAFELGKHVGAEERNKHYQGILKQTDSHIRFIEDQNERLSEKLEKMIIGQEE